MFGWFAAAGSVRADGVAVLGEGMQLSLYFGDGAGLGRLGADPFLEGLVEAFDLAAGLWVVGPGVLERDAQGGQVGLKCGASAGAGGVAGGEHHAVIGEYRRLILSEPCASRTSSQG